jgi:hypothetical protein
VRLSITQKHHQNLINSIALQLGTDDPRAALEHILNCWIVPCHVPQILASAPPQAKTTEDDFSGVVDWSE